MKLDIEYIDLLLVIEKALRERIVVWEDEEYRDIAEYIASEVKKCTHLR